MHVEPLETLPRSVREFMSHYAMIVLSILTALALEQVALGLEHRHEGARAKEEVEQEIASNRRAVALALKSTHENARAWNDLLRREVAAFKSGQSTNASRVAGLVESEHLFSDALPSLKTTAWDAALSDHSVNYLAHGDLTRYSELYASQRMFSQVMWDTLRDTAQHNLSDIALAVYLDKADPEPTLATLNSRMLTLRIIEADLVQLDAALKAPAAAEADERAAPAHGGGSAPSR